MGRLHLPHVAWLVVCAAAVHAQDSFDGKVPAVRTAPPPSAAPAPAPASPSPAPARPGEAGEAQDFGVKAITQLRPTAQLHGPTPTAIPGGKVVGTQQLAQWMQAQQGRVMLLHTIVSNTHLPNAIPAAPASQGGSFDDTVQRDFGAYLQKATGGDRSRLIVTYCQGVQCWGSYNAALRAIHLGYRNVHWYRGGMEAWQRAGLPLLN